MGFIFCLASSTMLGGEEPKTVLEVPFVHNRISVNGTLDEWAEYPALSFSPPDYDAELSPKIWVRTAWDKEKLYVAFWVKDKSLFAFETSDAGTPWRDDSVEVYLSVAPEAVSEGKLSPNEYQFIVNLNGAVGSCRGTSLGSRDHSWNADILSGVRWEGSLNDQSDPPDRGYKVEMAIPWKALGVEARSGIELLADFAVTNRVEAETPTGELLYFDWAGLKKFGNPAHWNRLILRRAPVTGDSDLFSEKKSATSPDTHSSAKSGWPGVFAGIMILSITIVVGIWIWRSGKTANGHGLQENDQLENEVPPEEATVSESLQVLARRVKQLLLADYAKDLTVGQVAGQLRVSERHMRRALKKVEGQNFSQILQEIRLKNACRLLEQSEMSIAEVAVEIGFGEQSYFSRLFKKQYSMSPSEYRMRSAKV